MKRKNFRTSIAIFIAIALFITSQVLPKEVNNLDEIWNFNFANCIANGLVPYKDFNIIQGPLSPIICSVFLKIFGQEMIVLRFLAIILDTAVLFMVYKIMGKLKIKKYFKYLTLITLCYIMKPYFTIDYNWITCFNALLIMYLEIKHEEETKPLYHFLIGLIAGISIAIKQTTGLIIVITLIGYKILEVRSFEDFKNFIKDVIFRTIGACVVPCIMVLILLKLGALKDYIDYCILGVTTFSNKISYIDGLIKNPNIVIKLISIILPIMYLSLIWMYIKTKKKDSLILLCFGIAGLILIYPIADSSHFVVAIPMTLIAISYILNILVKTINVSIKKEIIISSFLECLIVAISIYYSFLGIMEYNAKNKNIELQHFKNLPMSVDAISNIREIDKYIELQKTQVYILDATAALYMIPIDRYNKNYDMFLNGNLGSRGEQGQIENLEKNSQKIIMILNDNYRRNWQNPEKVRRYIKQNLTKKGQIGFFDVYE